MNVGKMYFYLIKPPFAPDFGLFEAKNSAFSTKTQGKMVLNAVFFDAKRETRSINIHNNCINRVIQLIPS